MRRKLSLQFRQLPRKLLVGIQNFPHSHKGADDKQRGFNRARGVEDRSRHDGAMFGENEWCIAPTAVPGS